MFVLATWLPVIRDLSRFRRQHASVDKPNQSVHQEVFVFQIISSQVSHSLSHERSQPLHRCRDYHDHCTRTACLLHNISGCCVATHRSKALWLLCMWSRNTEGSSYCCVCMSAGSRRTIDPEEPRSRTPGVWGGKQTRCLLLDSQEHFGPSPVSARRRTSANSSMI